MILELARRNLNQHRVVLLNTADQFIGHASDAEAQPKQPERADEALQSERKAGVQCEPLDDVFLPRFLLAHSRTPISN